MDRITISHSLAYLDTYNARRGVIVEMEIMDYTMGRWATTEFSKLAWLFVRDLLVATDVTRVCADQLETFLNRSTVNWPDNSFPQFPQCPFLFQQPRNNRVPAEPLVD